MRLAAALAALALHAPAPAATVHIQPCPDYTAVYSCAHFRDGDVYLDPALYQPRHPWRWMPTLAHELGHVWDYQHMTDDSRRKFAALVREPGSDWWAAGVTGLGDLPPAELFADAYSLCAMGARYRDWNLSDNWPYYLTAESRFMRPVTVAVTCWLIRHPPVP